MIWVVTICVAVELWYCFSERMIWVVTTGVAGERSCFAIGVRLPVLQLGLPEVTYDVERRCFTFGVWLLALQVVAHLRRCN